MILKYDARIKDVDVQANLNRIINQTYKLLPNREEGNEWQKPLETIMEELAGMDRLLIDQHETFFSLLSKMEGLFTLTDGDDFLLYRRTIFECLNLLSKISKECQD